MKNRDNASDKEGQYNGIYEGEILNNSDILALLEYIYDKMAEAKTPNDFRVIMQDMIERFREFSNKDIEESLGIL